MFLSEVSVLKLLRFVCYRLTARSRKRDFFRTNNEDISLIFARLVKEIIATTEDSGRDF
jgi:hypothetical protein